MKNILAKMKKTISYLSLFCILSVLVSGCSRQSAGNQREMASGGTTSGSSVSGEAARSDGTEESGERKDSADIPLEEHPFCSANCLYMADTDNQQLIQYCVKTNQEKTYEVKGILGLLLVEEDRIYYTKSFWNGENDEEEPEDLYRVCSIPVVSKKDGLEEPLVEREERLFGEPDIGSDYDYFYPVMDNDSLYYMPYDSDQLIRYDRHTKQKETVPVVPYFFGSLYPMRSERVCFFQKNSINVWNRKTDEMTNIDLPKNDDYEIDFTFDEEYIYFSSYQAGVPEKPDIKRVNISSKEEETFVTGREIADIISEKAGIKVSSLKRCEADLEVVGERLYLILSLEWIEGTCYKIQDVIVSRGLKAEDKLQYEEELTECIRKYGKTKRGEPKKFNNFTFGSRAQEERGIKEICYNMSFFSAIEEEKAYLNPNTEEFFDGEKYILLNRKTGKCKQVKKGMPEYYEFYYDRVWEEDYNF